MVQSNIADKSGIIRLDIADQNALYEAYMPFIKNGGLLVPQSELGDHNYELGDEVFLFLHLLFEDERLPVAAKICWMSPRGAQHAEGVGVQFLPKDGGKTQARLEKLLADRLNSKRPTKTL